MSRLRRAQFFSADFVVATVTLCFALGVLLHSGQLSLDSLSRYGQHDNNIAETVAASMVTYGAPQVPAASIQYTCWEYDNGTNSTPSCATVIGGSGGCTERKMDIYSVRRLVACSGSACLLTVKSCDVMLQ